MSDDLVVPASYKGTGGFGGRETVGPRWFNMLMRDAGLKPGDSVLDVGCGLGRIAVPLMSYLTARYEGFDIDAKAVGWCSENITPRAPNFRFKTAEVYNNRYNPEGKAAAETFTFPYEDGAFDVAFLASVFTHLLTKPVANYLKELRRVLKPGGRCVASYFLLNEAAERAIAAKTVPANRRFRTSMDGCRVQHAAVPERAVAHYETTIRALYEESGLRILDIRYGRWSGHPDAIDGQDIVFAVKS